MSETFKLGTDNFVSLAENKLEFARRICSDRELAQCLLSQDRSFKDYELPENYQDQLLWHHVFPFRYVLDTQESQRAYITMSFEFEKSEKPNVWKTGAAISQGDKPARLYFICSVTRILCGRITVCSATISC